MLKVDFLLFFVLFLIIVSSTEIIYNYYLSRAVLVFMAITHSSPQDLSTVHNNSLPASNSLLSCAPKSPSGSLRSSRRSPLSDIRQR
uniref:Putative secreted protein n=1 Tax=Panstrongylus lignarius TaxID=156445 RepID=A0A224Y3T4_9HEMI